jgi:hypothetical protein
VEAFLSHEKSNFVGRCDDHDDSIDELIGVVAGKDQRTMLRNVLLPQNFDGRKKYCCDRMEKDLIEVTEGGRFKTK